MVVGKCVVLCLGGRINVREKRRIGKGLVVDLRFLRVKEDGKSSVFCSSSLLFPRHPNRGVRLLCFCFVIIYF